MDNTCSGHLRAHCIPQGPAIHSKSLGCLLPLSSWPTFPAKLPQLGVVCMTLGLRIITDGSLLCCSAAPACGDAHGSFEIQIQIFEQFENSEIGRSFFGLFVTQPCAIACFVVSLQYMVHQLL